ncbi:MAG TPA: hypothetical protein VK066_02260 [Chloroflexota bacterium]|nr:hypothetical protein [Chloroflexota bacterium]
MDTWEDIRGLSPEEQTEWLKRHMKDWDRFVADIQRSHAQLEAHRTAGGTGLPPGWMWLDDYWKKRGLPNCPE